MENTTMRAYFFTNMYISSIQCGIQSAHATHELFNKYIDHQYSSTFQQLMDWSKNHKTMIVLNGGYASNLQRIYEVLQDQDNEFPFAKFNEEMDSLNGALTCVTVVLPERIYLTAAAVRSDRDARTALTRSGKVYISPEQHYGFALPTEGYFIHLTQFEQDLIEVMNGCGMAS